MPDGALSFVHLNHPFMARKVFAASYRTSLISQISVSCMPFRGQIIWSQTMIERMITGEDYFGTEELFQYPIGVVKVILPS
jgi:hypothetical protein